jgi:adenylate cyclase
MQISMKRRWRHWAICALIAIGATAGARLLSDFRFFQLLNLKALDAHFVLRGQQPTSQIVLVVADQKALDTFSEPLMFWHAYYADAIRAAGEAGAKVVGLDHAFGIPVDRWEPDSDRVLSEAVSASPIPVVCGYASSLNTNQAALPVPVNMLAAALGLSAFANLTVDADDFVRRQELIEDAADMPARSLALRVAEKYFDKDAVVQRGALTLDGHRIPIAADRSIYINYAGPPDTFPRVSLADVVAAERAGQKDQLREWLNGKIVLIGTDVVGEDRFATPFYTLFSGPRWTTAGVEIHANAVRTLLNRDFLQPASEAARIASLLAATAVTIGIVISVSAGPAAALLILEALAILLFTHLAFRAGLILPTSEMLVASAVCLIVSEVYRFSTAERRGNLFSKAISLFVGKELAASLEDTQTIRLSGKRLTVTILFTDIRGFTAFTEKVCDEQGPEVVVQMLNEYMSTMVAIILKHHGHVNKFIGDGILAAFSDEDDTSRPGDHSIRAVRCATEMVNAPSQFQTGAGIHTGLAVVGNVGSADKMEYTVLGDTVNLASRLESLNKEHKTKLLMSDATQKLLRDEVETTHLGTAAVRGKAAPIHLYTVTSLVESPKAVVNA